jgi:adenine-specific DNA-methyltransferase
VEHGPASDTPALRKARGAFYTPQPIAEYLADWAVEGNPSATVIDPTCGEAVFIEAAGRRLTELGASRQQLREQVFGVDLHDASVMAASTPVTSSPSCFQNGSALGCPTSMP